MTTPQPMRPEACAAFFEAAAASNAAESFATGAGRAGMALHVLSHDAGAQALYRSLGYRAASLNLFKPISKPPGRIA